MKGQWKEPRLVTMKRGIFQECLLEYFSYIQCYYSMIKLLFAVQLFY